MGKVNGRVGRRWGAKSGNVASSILFQAEFQFDLGRRRRCRQRWTSSCMATPWSYICSKDCMQPPMSTQTLVNPLTQIMVCTKIWVTMGYSARRRTLLCVYFKVLDLSYVWTISFASRYHESFLFITCIFLPWNRVIFTHILWVLWGSKTPCFHARHIL